MASLILVRGGGEIGSSVALRLMRAGMRVVITELPQPRTLRRTVSFAEAIYRNQVTVEGVTARLVSDPHDSFRILNILSKQQIPVLVDPACLSAKVLHPVVIVDGRMSGQAPEPIGYIPKLYIGLGAGFEAGRNCQVAIGIHPGAGLGKVYWQGGPMSEIKRRETSLATLRAPASGTFVPQISLGESVKTGQIVAEIQGTNGRIEIQSPSDGVVWGLLSPDIPVEEGAAVGEVAPGHWAVSCNILSEAALAVGGGVLEAILTRPEVRGQLW